MNRATIELVKRWESLHDGDLKKIGLQPKMDPIGIWTEGYGRVIINPATKSPIKGQKNKDLAYKYATIFIVEQALQELHRELGKYADIAARALTFEYWSRLNENQKGALTSFVYNCGTGRPEYKIFKNVRFFLDGTMKKDSLIEYWQKSVIKAGGVEWRGLKLRRADEAQLFFKNI
jgi:lysozyme